MRVICDAPGQTCKRLWTYVASVKQCIAENKKMAIIFYDWTIEDFLNLLYCQLGSCTVFIRFTYRPCQVCHMIGDMFEIDRKNIEFIHITRNK